MEQAQQFARANSLYFLGECSALEDINVKETINGLIQGIYRIQKELIRNGMLSERRLKVNDVDMAPNYEARSCCY